MKNKTNKFTHNLLHLQTAKKSLILTGERSLHVQNIEILWMTGEVHQRNKYFHATNN